MTANQTHNTWNRPPPETANSTDVIKPSLPKKRILIQNDFRSFIRVKIHLLNKNCVHERTAAATVIQIKPRGGGKSAPRSIMILERRKNAAASHKQILFLVKIHPLLLNPFSSPAPQYTHHALSLTCRPVQSVYYRSACLLVPLEPRF